MRLAYTLCLSAALALAALPVDAQHAPSEAIPPAMINGDRLEPGYGFSLKLPSPKWQWMRRVSSPLINFQAVDVENDRLFDVLVHNHGPLTEAVANDFIAGFRKGDPAQNAKVIDSTFEPTDIPRSGSYRFTAEVTVPNGTLYWNGYLVDLPRDRFCVIQEFRPTPGESPDFTSFVKSYLRTEQAKD